ncbi:hypothetical protein SAMN05444266_10438 [Chitinophaga jiangningensis]|uniref:DUF4175 family protein n=1 Tax=Chitinophaga jiangningensis TaxID=1419482 RepID=A0A1M7BSA4_9BACT|nr:hypothetical protein [Chitinophaga jiangningensis]SHL57871.1 hypothetical protein SAMN05444266_10438 [Chitinophaga jiangningensis]
MVKRGYNILTAWRNRWIILRIAAIVIQAMAVALTGCALWGKPGIFAGVAYLGIFLINFLLHLPDKTEMATWLNQQFPELEDSAGLFLKDPQQLNLLESLQVQKISARLALLNLPLSFYKPVWNSLVMWLIAGALSYIIYSRAGNLRPDKPIAKMQVEKVLPGILRSTITVTPPAYTGKQVRKQAAFNLLVEDSAAVAWEIMTKTPVSKVNLLFSDSSVLALKPGTDSTSWFGTKHILHPGFYQVQLDTLLSGYYQLQLIPDHPPLVKVNSPQPNTTIDFGRPPLVRIDARLTDDYAIKNAHIAATIASGTGEGVKFREQQFNFEQSFTARPNAITATKTLNLNSLGMKPGDEIYFHIAVTDSRSQQTLSDVFIVTMPDTAALFSMDGMVTALNIKPEYFRSQRQIIIETEALIRDKDSLGVAKFNSRSNELGTDQKLLRLRYGKFLGEESETNIGVGQHDHDDHDDHDHAKEPAFGDADALMDQFAHKHDNAEDATFFDPEIKKQLKATLTEMWKAELQLRLYKPQEALPYEYKALRLLKDLQQKSRAFVAKTGTKTTPLKPEKRLSGEQDKISPAIMKQAFAYNDPDAVVRAALSILDNPGILPSADVRVAELIRQALGRLTTAAAREPGKYLASMEALPKIQEGKAGTSDYNIARQGLYHLLQPRTLPQPGVRPQSKLEETYFKNLKKSGSQ